MEPHSHVLRARTTAVSSVHMCLLCRCRAVTDDSDESEIGSALLGRSESLLLGVCKHCQETYLAIGVALVNPETQSAVVITEEAFKAIFNQPIPEQKIVRVEEAVIEKVYGLFLVSQEAKANIARARRAMVN